MTMTTRPGLCSTLLSLFAATVLVSCGVEPMTSSSQVIRERIAGISASPPEIGVGESTELSALLVYPDSTAPPELGQIWFACLEATGATGCLGMDFGSMGSGEGLPGDDDDSAAPAVPDVAFGIGPTFTYTAQGPELEAAWEDLEPEERVEGLTVLVSTAFVEKSNDELLALVISLASGDEDVLAEAQAELESLMDSAILGARRIVISDKSAGQPDPVPCAVSSLLPNQSPELGRLLLHEDPKGRDSGIELADRFVVPEPGAALHLRPQLAEGSIEDYLYILRDGGTECRKEAPYFAWLSNGGTHLGDYSFTADDLDEDEVPGRPKVHSFVPPVAGEFTQPIDLWLVVRDRRGGMVWRHWQVLPAP